MPFITLPQLPGWLAYAVSQNVTQGLHNAGNFQTDTSIVNYSVTQCGA